MAPVVTTKAEVHRGNNSKVAKKETADNNSSTDSSCNHSRCSSRSSQSRTINSREKSRSSTPPTAACNQKKTESSKFAKTPASAKLSPSSEKSPATDQPSRKTVAAHPLPSAMLHKHKQASVFTSGKKKHKTSVLVIFLLAGLSTYTFYEFVHASTVTSPVRTTQDRFHVVSIMEVSVTHCSGRKTLTVR
ncbi:unnamed protein product [Phytophthora fragariaefolia]|uniref:Unnamed protein product n=1 Tax=Phytophthora fragariaefolia TaxID=1490495 RepID=A0A9W6TVE0_9STRA|nr:unnamed protein product [Phytophthora fragariaefolia]